MPYGYLSAYYRLYWGEKMDALLILILYIAIELPIFILFWTLRKFLYQGDLALAYTDTDLQEELEMTKRAYKVLELENSALEAIIKTGAKMENGKEINFKNNGIEDDD